MSSLFDRFDEGACLSALGKSEKTADPKRRRESQGSSLPFRSFPFAARRVIVIMPGWKIIGGWGSGKLRRYLSLMHVLDATEREESVGGPSAMFGGSFSTWFPNGYDTLSVRASVS